MPLSRGNAKRVAPLYWRRCRNWLVWVALVAPAGWMLGPAAVTDRFFVFRDVAHFYLPLWYWMRNEWFAGRVPLWNPYDGFGVPLAADGTSAAFYPLWWLFFSLPFSLALCAKLYLTAHVLLAAFGANRLVRHWQGSPEAGALAGIAYAYGGSVLFQVCNPPFLIGAAWLPWAVLFAERLLRKAELRSGIGLAIISALMVLGGDPQMAFQVILITALGVVWYGKGMAAFRNSIHQRCWNDLVVSRPMLLLLACCFAGCLAAVQVLPSMEWARKSSRAQFEKPRNIYEAASYVTSRQDVGLGKRLTNCAVGLLGVPEEFNDNHHAQIYQYSQGPWRWIELAWPNISGRMFPTHRRWMDAIPAEGIVWTPSLYMGLIPFLLALTQFRFMRGSPRQRWLSWVAALFAGGSLGWYGIGWLMREIYAGISGSNSSDVWLGQPVGGVYWFFVTFLPGYVYFRYPAKLWVVTALMLSLLAGHGWDRMSLNRPRWWFLTTCTLAIGSLFGAAFVHQYSSKLWTWFQVGSDAWFGPFDAHSASADVSFGLLHAASMGAIAAASAFAPRSQKVSRAVLVLTVIDICLANSWILPTASLQLWALPAAQSNDISLAHNSKTRNDSLGPKPDSALSKPKVEFVGNSSVKRLEEILSDRRQHLFSHFRMLDPVGSFKRPGAESTLQSADLVRYLEGTGQDVENQIEIGPRIDIQGKYCVIPPFLNEASRRGYLRDFSARRTNSTVVELPRDSEPPTTGRLSDPQDEIRFVRQTSQQLTIGLNLANPNYLVVRDLYDPEWTATIEANGQSRTDTPIRRADGVFRAVAVPAGGSVVTFSYRPRAVFVGGVISALAWLGLIASSWRRIRAYPKLMAGLRRGNRPTSNADAAPHRSSRRFAVK